MSFERVDVVTVAYSDVLKSGEPGDKYWHDVAEAFSFRQTESDNVRMLSQNGIKANAITYGVIYVPELSSESCKGNASTLVPVNVTRRSNLPSNTYSLVALAPWFSPECTLQYLAATSGNPVAAFIFFLPDNSSDIPPLVNDKAWFLKDGGAWKKTYRFPVFAIPSSIGFKLINELTHYSSNASKIPFREEIISAFPDSEFIQLGAEIRFGSRSALPNLWVFLLIVASMLVVIVCSASAVMHIIQRTRRNNLRRRVRNGEVDLEALGVKRLTVPQAVLEKLPIYRLDGNLEPSQSPEGPARVVSPTYHFKFNIKKLRDVSMTASSISDSASPTTGQPAYSQTHCSICLDEFSESVDEKEVKQEVLQMALVRELPCRHIFHPMCIDNFLLNNSSLCPICKVSVLPKGFCDVPITNAMVRRERRARQPRSQTLGFQAISGGRSMSFRAIERRMQARRASHQLGRQVSNESPHQQPGELPSTTGPSAPEMEMAEATRTSQHQDTDQTSAMYTPRNSTVRVSGSTSREEQVPESSARAVLPTNIVDADEEALRDSKWKRLLRRLFPV